MSALAASRPGRGAGPGTGWRRAGAPGGPGRPGRPRRTATRPAPAARRASAAAGRWPARHPARELPMITPMRSRSRPVPPGKPAAASARAAVSRASQCAGSVAPYTAPDPEGLLVELASPRSARLAGRARGRVAEPRSAAPPRRRGGRHIRLVAGLEGGQVQAAGRHAPERPPARSGRCQQGGRVQRPGTGRPGRSRRPSRQRRRARPQRRRRPGRAGRPAPADRRKSANGPAFSRTQSFAGGVRGVAPRATQLFPKTRFPRTTQFPLSPANGLFPPRANSGPLPLPGMWRVTDICPGGACPGRPGRSSRESIRHGERRRHYWRRSRRSR